MTVIETHSRTLLKTVVYRVLCTIAIFLIAMALGAGSAASGTLAITIVILGTIIYYIHDRVWNRFSWNRNESGAESTKRSLVKTIVYRLITVVIGVALARLIITDSNQTALAFGISQFVVNMLLYFLVERVFNRFSIGRKEVNGV